MRSWVCFIVEGVVEALRRDPTPIRLEGIVDTYRGYDFGRIPHRDIESALRALDVDPRVNSTSHYPRTYSLRTVQS